MALNGFQRTSYRILGNFSARRFPQDDLATSLQRARIPVRSEAYIASAISSAILAFLTTLVLAAFVVLAMLPALGISSGHPLAIVGLLATPPLMAGLVYLILITSPKSRAKARAKSIEEHLPYGLNYIAAMASAGVPIHIIFESLAGQPIYGELAGEARAIAKDLRLGVDSVQAMDRASRRSPSERWGEVMQGAITTVTSGGDLKSFFAQKAERYAWENRQTQKKFVEVMGLMAETYVTAVVAGPLFLIVMMAIMAMLGGGDLTMLRLITYMLLPVANAGFAYGLAAISPKV